jgi:hypothetical protein
MTDHMENLWKTCGKPWGFTLQIMGFHTPNHGVSHSKSWGFTLRIMGFHTPNRGVSHSKQNTRASTGAASNRFCVMLTNLFLT